MAHHRRRPGVLLRLVFTAYVVALAALPFAHHDLLCHLKSSTHCATCHIGTSTDHGGAHPALAPVDLPDAGHAGSAQAVILSSAERLPSSGRSPPSTTASLV